MYCLNVYFVCDNDKVSLVFADAFTAAAPTFIYIYADRYMDTDWEGKLREKRLFWCTVPHYIYYFYVLHMYIYVLNVQST